VFQTQIVGALGKNADH